MAIRDFKKETLEFIDSMIGKDAVIDEYLFKRDFSIVVKGRNTIDWEQVRSKLFTDNSFDYEAGFGADEILGFITFKNDDRWLEREEYDGSSHWVRACKPTLSPDE